VRKEQKDKLKKYLGEPLKIYRGTMLLLVLWFLVLPIFPDKIENAIKTILLGFFLVLLFLSGRPK
jgi:hypothetical protein